MEQDLMADIAVREALFFPDCSRTVDRQPDWYVVYVKSRHEFLVSDELQRKGIATFLPSFRAVRQWKDRKKTIECALFPGYVFIEAASAPGAFLNVLKTRGVVAIISQEQGKPSPVAPDELRALRILVESGRDLDLYPGLQLGTKVRVKNGPLKNAEGILLNRANECLFLVNLSLLGRSVSVKIFAQDIEAQ